MVYDSFLDFMRLVVLPRKAANPRHIRLDGATSGGSREVVGTFRRAGQTWVVHADTHFEPLMIAYEAARQGKEPFAENETQRGRCLVLTDRLRARQRSHPKYLYIYSWQV